LYLKNAPFEISEVVAIAYFFYFFGKRKVLPSSETAKFYYLIKPKQ